MGVDERTRELVARKTREKLEDALKRCGVNWEVFVKEWEMFPEYRGSILRKHGLYPNIDAPAAGSGVLEVIEDEVNKFIEERLKEDGFKAPHSSCYEFRYSFANTEWSSEKKRNVAKLSKKISNYESDRGRRNLTIDDFINQDKQRY